MYLPSAQEARRRERCRRKPLENSPPSHPRWSPTTSPPALKLVRTPRRTLLPPPSCCATVAHRPSYPTGERDRYQPGALRYPIMPASAAQRGGAVIMIIRRRVREVQHFSHSSGVWEASQKIGAKSVQNSGRPVDGWTLKHGTATMRRCDDATMRRCDDTILFW